MKGFFMLILFCQNKLISKTFSESLAPFSPVICESEEDFLERLPSAKLAIIDENIQLYQKYANTNKYANDMFRHSPIFRQHQRVDE